MRYFIIIFMTLIPYRAFSCGSDYLEVIGAWYEIYNYYNAEVDFKYYQDNIFCEDPMRLDYKDRLAHGDLKDGERSKKMFEAQLIAEDHLFCYKAF